MRHVHAQSLWVKLSAFHTRFYQYCINCTFAVIMTATLFGISWRLALIALPGIPFTFLLDHLVSRREKKVNEVLNRNDAAWATWLNETLKGWKEIRVNKCEAKRKKEFADFSGVDETHFTTWLRFWTTRVLVIPMLKDEFIMQFVLYFAGGTFLYYRQLSVGALLIFVQYYRLLSDHVKEASASDADLYVLDEATSALDNQVEEGIKESLNCIPRDKTVIVVAHKKSFLDLCDYVIRIGGDNSQEAFDTT